MKLIRSELLRSMFLLYLAVPLILPNSLRQISVPLFCMVGAITISLSYRYIGKAPLFVYLLIAVNSLFYLLVGVSKAHPEALDWTVFVYILSPLTWMSYWTYLLYKFEISKITRILAIYSVLGCLSVYFFIFLFLTFGPTAVTIFISEPNVEFSEGRIGATMHVFGSLIFLSSAFIASPNVLSKWVQPPLILLLILTAITSGRTALILAVIIGLSINFLASSGRLRAKYIIYCAIGFLCIIFIMGASSAFSDDGEKIDVFTIATEIISKIGQGGGDERVRQFDSLIDGIYESNFIGAGHGVSASVIRNDANPWKYELLWVSTIFHTGIFGFLIYSIPALLVFFAFFKLAKKENINDYDIFVLSGFLSILIASNTNPYLQSFDFQWMFVFPCVYFYNRYQAMKFKNSND